MEEMLLKVKRLAKSIFGVDGHVIIDPLDDGRIRLLVDGAPAEAVRKTFVKALAALSASMLDVERERHLARASEAEKLRDQLAEQAKEEEPAPVETPPA